jgi:two-component system, NtrC family, sensor kinase
MRRALMVRLTVLVVLTAFGAGGLGLFAVARDIRRESQERVNHELASAEALYQRQLESTRRDLAEVARSLNGQQLELDHRFADTCQRLELDFCGISDPAGRLLAAPDNPYRVPVATDEVILRASRGQASAATMDVPIARLRAESYPGMSAPMADLGEPRPAQGVLFMWGAVPVRDAAGRVRGVVYGGRAIERNDRLVDDMRAMLFGDRTYRGKPLGTVTLFHDDRRVATNVLGARGERAVGTRVSPEVRRRVLVDEGRWQDRAWVVDRWYVSAYAPLLDAGHRTVGMLYVGMLEAPYSDWRRRSVGVFFGSVVITLLGAAAVGLVFARHVTRPLAELAHQATRMAEGEREARAGTVSPYAELRDLSAAFREMQQSIAQRDRELLQRNLDLDQANQQLTRVNQNYMTTLGFVAHELKSPLAAVQSIIDTALTAFGAQVSAQLRNVLVRIQRNVEELQDMVKNYLDLARAERGELASHPQRINLHHVVVEPSVQQTEALLASRSLALSVDCPQGIEIDADPELLRIALVNYLSNAAKYAREGGQVQLTVVVDRERVCLRVWNEGTGFTEQERAALFQKFSRLKNANTRGKRGSGLGLFLARQIAELHGGSVSARSEPNSWAEFSLELPMGRTG